MSNTPPTTAGEAFANLAARLDRLRGTTRRTIRYAVADRHRARLVQSGQYMKTSSRRK